MPSQGCGGAAPSPPPLSRLSWWAMRQRLATLLEVAPPRIVQAFRPVRAQSNFVAVVIVLAVVFPSALSTKLVPATFGKREVTAAGTRVRLRPRWRDDVAQLRVVPEALRLYASHFLGRFHKLHAQASPKTHSTLQTVPPRRGQSVDPAARRSRGGPVSFGTCCGMVSSLGRAATVPNLGQGVADGPSRTAPDRPGRGRTPSESNGLTEPQLHGKHAVNTRSNTTPRTASVPLNSQPHHQIKDHTPSTDP